MHFNLLLPGSLADSSSSCNEFKFFKLTFFSLKKKQHTISCSFLGPVDSVEIKNTSEHIIEISVDAHTDFPLLQ